MNWIARGDRRWRLKRAAAIFPRLQFEARRFFANPFDERAHRGRCGQRVERIELTFELLLRKERVNLRVTRLAESDGGSHLLPGKKALIPLVVVTRARDQVMSGENIFPAADRTDVRSSIGRVDAGRFLAPCHRDGPSSP